MMALGGESYYPKGIKACRAEPEAVRSVGRPADHPLGRIWARVQFPLAARCSALQCLVHVLVRSALDKFVRKDGVEAGVMLE